MKVLKFGGTSVANSENIQKVKAIIESEKQTKQIVVVSAFGGITDVLLRTANLAKLQDTSYTESFKEIEKRHFEVVEQLIPTQNQSGILSNVKQKINQLETLMEGIFLLGEISPKTSDKVVSYGELLSSYIISEYLKSQGIDCEYKDSRELIKTNSNYTNASVNYEVTYTNCKSYFGSNKHDVTLLPGFVASSENGTGTTLGRGGSDFTASIYASAVDADILEIWTDVSGMYTSNPRIVSEAKVIEEISYEEAMELSHFGAKVLYPPTILPVLNKKIPIVIKNTFSPEDKGTLIVDNPKDKDDVVTGISNIDNIALLLVEGGGMIGVSGVSKSVFEVLSQNEINVILITQASSEHSICIGIQANQAEKAKQAIDTYFSREISEGKINAVQIEKEMSIIALVGDNMKNHQGLSGKMFSTLGQNNVNIRAIAQGASEKNISAVIKTNDVTKAINSLHERFFEDNAKQLNLFITGIGNVGGKFLEQINNQTEYLRKNLKLNVRVIGISNSRNMIFEENGIDLSTYQDKLNKGETADYKTFFEKAKSLNLRNSIFVDNTANAEISTIYEDYLNNNIAVVTCNKIACSSSYQNYSKLKGISQEYLVPFLFETNVGAGLPIIDTLKNLIASGDSVTEIQAVLSGSLNFVFNNFNASTTFKEVVLQAKEQGYTEPDPKIDLSGVDVMRKILILARESGYKMELEDIKNNSFLPEECLNTTSVDDFIQSLDKYENHFQEIFKNANDKDCRLKYVASFKDGKAQVGLQEIPSNHPFYNLEGSDNIVLFYTERYSQQPLIIKGAGAGADVTASGIFADVIRIGRI
ncbi:MAG: bifunctional aspartate kinase/homoserine dehydrogenase I [Flavobacteriales bacterium]|nr:bifunctional aspartate kinase/homoserine dehydrogenase I [Flavobacteriales bacterium]